MFITAFVLTSCTTSSAIETIETIDTSNFSARTRNTTAAFGTLSVLRLYEDFSIQENAVRFDTTWQQTLAILGELNDIFSHSVYTSETNAINALEYGQSIQVSYHMATVIQIAKDLHTATAGYFDPSVFPIVDLWGFSPRFNVARFEPVYSFDRPQRNTVPDPYYIQAFLPLVNFGNITLDGNVLTKNIAPVSASGTTYHAQLDFGAILKGYATDLVGQIIRENGFSFGHFSTGGSSFYILNGMDTQEDYTLRLGLRRPRDGQAYTSSFMRLPIQNTSLSTSGDYSHMFFVDDVRYSHIFDPTTGWPVNTPTTAGNQSGLAKVSVLAPSGTTAEGLSTAIMAMGPVAGLELINRLGYEVVMVYYTQGCDTLYVYTNIAHYRIEMLDPAFVLVD